MEFRRRTARRSGRSWTRRLESPWHQDPRHSCGARRIRGEFRRGTVGRGAEVVGRHPIHPGLAMFMASTFPVRRATMQPLAAHSSTTTVRRICARSRLGMQQTMEALLGRIPGSLTQVAMARHITTLPMNGRPRFEVSREDSGRRLLGLMG